MPSNRLKRTVNGRPSRNPKGPAHRGRPRAAPEEDHSGSDCSVQLLTHQSGLSRTETLPCCLYPFLEPPRDSASGTYPREASCYSDAGAFQARFGERKNGQRNGVRDDMESGVSRKNVEARATGRPPEEAESD